MPASFSPALDARRIASALAGQALGQEVQVHAELPSTNDRAMELGLAGFPHGLVVLAESQSAGRGRRDNRWLAPPGRDLLMSVLLRPAARMEWWPRMTAIAALALCRTIESVRPLRPMIKWPNDVYCGNRKIAGILGETFASGASPFMVLGMGLNVNGTQFPPELRDSATSLLLESGAAGVALERNSVAIALLKQLSHLSDRLEENFGEILKEVKPRSWLLGKQVTAMLPEGPVVGEAVDLDANGHLVVREAALGNLRVLVSAEQVRVLDSPAP